MSNPRPTEINLHQKSKILNITFDDAEQFAYSCEYLRCFSPSAEVQGHGHGEEVLQVGKEHVGIDKIEPVGNYAICIYFDDGHDTGLYSWETLYQLGKNMDVYWGEYLVRLESAGHKRRV